MVYLQGIWATRIHAVCVNEPTDQANRHGHGGYKTALCGQSALVIGSGARFTKETTRPCQRCLRLWHRAVNKRD